MDRLLAVRLVVERRRGSAPARRATSGSCTSTARASASSPLAFHHSSSIASQPQPCMKPPSIWPRSIAGLSDAPTSCRMSTAQQPVLAGQRVDRDLGHRRAVGEVEERPARSASCGRSGSSASRRSRWPTAARARSTRRRASSANGSVLRAGADDAVARTRRSAGVAVELARGERGEALAQRARRVARGHAVDVAAGRGGRRRRVRHLARVRRRHAHRRDSGTPSSCATTCGTLVNRPWPISVPPWFSSTRAVVVDVQQRAGLVVVRRGERDAELDRRERDAALDHRAARGSTRRSPRAARGSATSPRAASMISGAMLSSIVMPYGVTLRVVRAVEIDACARRADRGRARARSRR